MDKDFIKIFEETQALLHGHFILSSGLHSDTYFQCAKVLQYPKYLSMFGEILSNHFSHLDIDKVISPAIGGIVLGTEVGRQLNKKTIFSERSEGAMKLRRGFNVNENEKILIIEDVLSTGGSIKEVIDLIAIRSMTSFIEPPVLSTSSIIRIFSFSLTLNPLLNFIAPSDRSENIVFLFSCLPTSVPKTIPPIAGEITLSISR